jgi:hypothetical protein
MSLWFIGRRGCDSLVGEVVVQLKERLWFIGRKGFGSLVRMVKFQRLDEGFRFTF